MAPLPPNSTTRYELKYSDGHYTHSLINRVAGGVTSADAAAAYDALLSAFEDTIGRVTIIGLFEYASGSNISLEIPWPGAATYGSSGDRFTINAPYAFVFTGRSVLGRRTKLAVFGPLVINDDSYKVTAAESGIPGVVKAVLEQPDGCFVAIDGAEAVWHPYMLVTPFHKVIEKARNG